MKRLTALALTLLSINVFGAIIEQKINYTHNNTSLTGYLYYDNSIKTPKPLVLVAHEWWGLNDYAKSRAKQLAGLGYVGFAIDMYGKDQQTKHGKQAKTWMQAITKNKAQWQQRAITALELGKKHPQVDSEKTAAIGYCFGGATVMQMAYAGADLDAIISFHGSLIPPTTKQANVIKPSLLIHNGAADKFINTKAIQTWQTAMEASGADWVFVNHANAKHGFTNPNAGDYGIGNLAYNQKADKRSWTMMQDFLQQQFK